MMFCFRFVDYLRILTGLLSLSVCLCERAPSLTTVDQSLEVFAKKLLKQLTHEDTTDGRYNRNLVVSPMGVWSLLALIAEGAAGTTETQLKESLFLPSDANIVRRGYRSIKKALVAANSNGTSLEDGNAIFTDVNRPLQEEFEYVAESHYMSTVRGIDLRNPAKAADEVNSWVASVTHGRINNLISSNDIVDAELILGNAVYFQGAWAVPFNATFTVNRPFYADYGRIVSSSSSKVLGRSVKDEPVVGVVPMMYQSGPFKLAYSDVLKAQIVELPYEGEQLSMLVVLPKEQTSLSEVFANLRNLTLTALMNILDTQSAADEDGVRENIDVFLPRFNINTQVEMKEHLQELGIVDMFEATKADLRKLARTRVYVSKVVHRAEIKVSEEGTVASAATVATINNFSMPSVFNANHPFLFIVIEKSTKAIVFAGKVSNPNIS